MLIRCWGSRGSIAVSGPEYLKYGGDTTCLELSSKDDDLIIIDAGTGIRALGRKLVEENRRRINLLLTHAHWDHLSGFPFFNPIYREQFEIKVCGPQPTQESVKKIISRTMSPPYFPIELEDISAEINFFGMGDVSFTIGPVRIKTIALSHPNQGVGYRFEEDKKSFVFLTDNELTFRHPTGLDYRDYVEFSKGADLLFHDAEFTPGEYEHTRGWGHSVYVDTVNLAIYAGVKRLGLFHHNQNRTDQEVDRIVEDCRRIIREKGAKLDCVAVATVTEGGL